MTFQWFSRKFKNTLRIAQELVRQEKCTVSKGAIIAGASLGFSETEIKESISKLTKDNFYHSTQEKHNPKVSQDVYKLQLRNVNLYIKYKIVDNGAELIITSFKEDTADK